MRSSPCTCRSASVHPQLEKTSVRCPARRLWLPHRRRVGLRVIGVVKRIRRIRRFPTRRCALRTHHPGHAERRGDGVESVAAGKVPSVSVACHGISPHHLWRRACPCRHSAPAMHRRARCVTLPSRHRPERLRAPARRDIRRGREFRPAEQPAQIANCPIVLAATAMWPFRVANVSAPGLPTKPRLPTRSGALPVASVVRPVPTSAPAPSPPSRHRSRSARVAAQPPDDRRQDRLRGAHPGRDVDHRKADLHRRRRRPAALQRHHPRRRLDHVVVGAAGTVGSTLSPAGDRAIDDVRPHGADVVRSQPKPLGYAWTEVFDEDVGLLRQASTAARPFGVSDSITTDFLPAFSARKPATSLRSQAVDPVRALRPRYRVARP